MCSITIMKMELVLLIAIFALLCWGGNRLDKRANIESKFFLHLFKKRGWSDKAKVKKEIAQELRELEG
jgi:hypothetical protein